MIEHASAVDTLLARSRALGADRRVTNFGGGNTSCKTAGHDPLSGEPRAVLWVKGSGGDLGTLTRDGLAALDIDKVRALESRFAGPDDDDALFELLDHCRVGPGGAAPSIDTAMHALLDDPHVDHLHPDAVIALAAAADSEALTKRCYGEEVAWVPWQRPGYALGLLIAEARRASPELRGVVLGGHGLTAWGSTSDECRDTSLELIARAEAFIAEEGRPDPLGAVVPGFEPLPADERHALAAALAPHIRGLASTDTRVIGRYDGSAVVLDFVSREAARHLVPLGTSCPDHFLRTKVRPLLLDVPPTAGLDAMLGRLRELHREYRDEYASYYARYASADSPPMRGADPAIVLVPGVGMFSFGSDAQTARVAGEFYLNAINVMTGAEALSRYEPVPESEKFGIEYWALEEAKLRRRPTPRAMTGKVALVTGAGSGIGRATAMRLASEGAAVVIADRDLQAGRGVAEEIGSGDSAVAVAVDVADESEVAGAFAEACLAYGGVDVAVNNAGLSLSAPVVETTTDDWDVQHTIMARGSFLVSRRAAQILIAQGMGGDIVYVVSKNAVAAGPNNVAYGAAKAAQAHQVRLLATELGAYGIRVNGVNPDAVVKGSGIFAGSWGDDRAAVYGVPREDLGAFYAERTLLKTEILPEHVAAAIFVLVGGELPVTTGTFLAVDGGVAAAFMR